MASSSSDKDVETLLLLARHQWRKRNKRTPKHFCVRFVFTQHRCCGAFSMLIQEMRLSDPELHFGYIRMSKERFDHLLLKVWITPQIYALPASQIYALPSLTLPCYYLFRLSLCSHDGPTTLPIDPRFLRLKGCI